MRQPGGDFEMVMAVGKAGIDAEILERECHRQRNRQEHGDARPAIDPSAVRECDEGPADGQRLRDRRGRAGHRDDSDEEGRE